MRKILTRNSFVFCTTLSMLLLYVATTVGFGLHICNSSKSAHMYLSFTLDLCSHETVISSEEESCTCSKCIEESQADRTGRLLLAAAECCTSSYYQIDSDQLDSRGVSVSVILPVVIRHADTVVETDEMNHLSLINDDLSPSVDIPTFCSQWRI